MAANNGTVTPAVNTVNDEEFINKIYDSNLAGQKATIQQGYDKGMSDLNAAQQKQQKQTDANLNKTYVDAYRGRKNYGEVQNAYGLTSGAMAQARLAQNNQLQSDMTTIRSVQQEADAEAERQKALLGQQYASDIAKAQSENDFQRAQALYEAAKRDEDTLLGLQKEAGQLMASKNDYSILGALYGLTPEQIAKLQGAGYVETSAVPYAGLRNPDGTPVTDKNNDGVKDQNDVKWSSGGKNVNLFY